MAQLVRGEASGQASLARCPGEAIQEPAVVDREQISVRTLPHEPGQRWRDRHVTPGVVPAVLQGHDLTVLDLARDLHHDVAVYVGDEVGGTQGQAFADAHPRAAHDAHSQTVSTHRGSYVVDLLRGCQD